MFTHNGDLKGQRQGLDEGLIHWNLDSSLEMAFSGATGKRISWGPLSSVAPIA